MAVDSENLRSTRQLCLVMMSTIYLFAFSSLYTQIPGELYVLMLILLNSVSCVPNLIV